MTTSASRRRAAGLLLTVPVAAALAACSSGDDRGTPDRAGGTSSSVVLGSAAAGDLTVTGGYVPAPPSPDVASAYLTITDDGATDETLTAVSSDAAAQVVPMTETTSGTTGSMTDLAHFTVPAHGRVRFTPDHAHLMLEQPRALAVGDTVTLTLTFDHAGPLRVSLPVLPFSGSTGSGTPGR